MEENMDIRLAAKGAGVPLWKIARALNVSDVTLYRWLREPFPAETKAKILSIIDDLKPAK